jgi:hypothetical protein
VLTNFVSVDSGAAVSFDAVTPAGTVIGTLTIALTPSHFYLVSLTDSAITTKRQVRYCCCS